GHVPLYPRIVQSGDEGAPIVSSDAASGAAKALDQIASAVAERAGVTAGTGA
ncbi:MAG: sodium:proton antiporter, partial [Gemmatimonadetes bacterium]|nr:sodium:proton antiporter [Gemmatimonadota bacterium]